MLASLPKRLLSKIDRLSGQTGESPIKIIQKGVELYERIIAGNRDAEDLTVVERDVLRLLMRKLAKRKAQTMTPDERSKLGKSLNDARNAKLTPEQRSAIASNAAKQGGRGRKKQPGNA